MQLGQMDGMGGSFPETDATIRVPAVRISVQGSKKNVEESTF